MALRRVFTYLGAVFLMSHIIFVNNVGAVEISQQVEFLSGYHYPYWSDNHGRSYDTGGYSYSTNGNYSDASILYFRSSTNGALSASAGRFVSLTGSITMTVTSNSQIVSIQANPRQYFAISSANVDCPLIDFTDVDYQQYQSGSNTWRLRYNFVTVCRLKQNITSNVAMNIYLNGASTSGTDTLNFNPQFLAFWGAVDGYDDTEVINAIGRLTTAINNLGTKIDGLGNKIDNINNESAEATQDASDNAETEADSSGNSAESGSASLISTIGSAVSAITSASPTNCLLNGNMGNFDMGQIDLCANSVPAFVQIIGSLILILVTVPLCIVLFNRFIGLFRSFQG